MHLTLDAGALIAFERRDRRMEVIVHTARTRGDRLAVPAGVLAQVWRDGRTQAELAMLLRLPFVDVVPLTAVDAKLAGQACALAGTADIVDASVVVVAGRQGGHVVTSDPDDLRRLDPTLPLVVI